MEVGGEDPGGKSSLSLQTYRERGGHVASLVQLWHPDGGAVDDAHLRCSSESSHPRDAPDPVARRDATPINYSNYYNRRLIGTVTKLPPDWPRSRQTQPTPVTSHRL
ncbi:hypothetical protein PGT21_005096 [Puccinia graminis f. sp. tritici]|uniref:Uncharacterized protein n=1 Tax=Puccinia graminis f. sp. tritici TaxID=56615 RepID=A0A5B0PQR8_PUCGR|nr:hypothetical protein PGT21_005096 [Puccinia graminis f. sp. tritici]